MQNEGMVRQDVVVRIARLIGKFFGLRAQQGELVHEGAV